MDNFQSLLIFLSLCGLVSLGLYFTTRKRLRLNEVQTRELESENIRLKTELEINKRSFEAYTESQKQLEDSFSKIAQEALRGNNQQFIELAKQNFEKEGVKLNSEFEKRQIAIDSLVAPLKDMVDKYQKHSHEMEKERQKSYLNLENELKKITQTHSSLASETRALKDALKKPHVRGRWGEVQLKNCIELAGMSEYCDVSFQDSTTLDDGSRLIPDMTVRMPGGRTVVVDAKTPIDAFLNSLEEKDKEKAGAEVVRHGLHVKKHIQQLSSKAYSANLKNSADFTVMFLPNESFLYAALETQADLVEYALSRKVLIATPPTLIGLLKIIRFGWNEEKLAENAHNISEAGKELHKRICDFTTAFTSIGKHLDKAQEEYNKGLTRLESRVLVQTKRLEKLGAKSNKDLPEELLITESEHIDSTNDLDV